jgi:hypothetical protein
MLMFPRRVAAIGSLVFAVSTMIGRASTTDKLTGLPLYPGSPFTMDLPAYSYCGAATKGTMYQPAGKVATIDRWYAAHLPAFHFYHAIRVDRTQDSFAKPDGTEAVNVTGVSGSSGNVYAVSYARFSRPLTPTAMASIVQATVKCR